MRFGAAWWRSRSLSEYQAMAFSNPADTTQHTMSGIRVVLISGLLAFLFVFWMDRPVEFV